MLPPSNYRISLKKNISLNTINHFHQSKSTTDSGEPNLLKGYRYSQSKKSFQRLTTQNSIMAGQKTLQKTFSFDSSDQFIKRILLENGWHLLPSDFTHVKLKWMAIPKPLHFKPQLNQLLNHFKDSYKLTTKLGLYNLLSNPHQQKLTDHNGQNYIKYFPRSYDLGAEFEAFCYDFTHTAVMNLMKKLMIHVEMVHERTLYQNYKMICQRQCFKNGEERLLEEIQLVLRRKDDIFQEQSGGERVMVNKNVFIHLLKYWKYFLHGNHYSKTFSPFTQSLKAFSKLNPPFNNPDMHFSKQSEIAFLTHSSAILFFKLYFYCLQTNANFLNDGLSNIWIIKSNESSRGRNIFLIDDIDQVQPYKNGGNRLIQKYIENVWILNSQVLGQQMQTEKICKIVNKKFDIRFWVLVKSFAPLDVYIFSQGYLRLSSETYKFMDHESLQKNIKTHLTNFSVNFLPYLKNQRPSGTDSECDDDNSYLLFSDFLSFIEGQGDINSSHNIEKSDLFKKIVQQISHILTIASVNWRPCESDKNSFQLFGFDIILDSELEPYVLECNMSPACHERGELKRLVEEMGEGLLEIVGLIKKDFPKEQLLNEKRRKWIKLREDPCHQLQNKEAKTKKNCQDLSIIGESVKAKFILEQDNVINFVSKICYLQKFFKNRYKDIGKDQRDTIGVAKGCKMIEVLAKIVKKRQAIWEKKLIKYIKRQNKKKLALQNMDSKNQRPNPN